jgi:hypothetical protein
MGLFNRAGMYVDQLLSVDLFDSKFNSGLNNHIVNLEGLMQHRDWIQLVWSFYSESILSSLYEPTPFLSLCFLHYVLY